MKTLSILFVVLAVSFTACKKKKEDIKVEDFSKTEIANIFSKFFDSDNSFERRATYEFIVHVNCQIDFMESIVLVKLELL